MYIIIVKNLKKKLLMVSVIIAIWVLMFLASDIFLNKGLFFNVTIDDCLTFSYPLRFEVENIFVNDKVSHEAIETSFSFKPPLSQKLVNFQVPEGNFSFLYPSTFILSQKDYSGSDILYHIDFKDNSLNSHGFVQVWSMPYPLEEFLNSSKEASNQNYKYFNVKAVIINDIPGYHWDYSVLGSDGTFYKGSEVFLKKDERMYRISYFVPESLWNKAQSDTYWNIVKSFKID